MTLKTEIGFMENPKIITDEQISIKEVMTSPVITVKANACIPLIAQFMDHYSIGSVIVTSNQGKSVGIITQRDLVVRILTRISDTKLVKRILGNDPSHNMLTAGDVMSSPLAFITPDKTLVEATRIMRHQNIRRLVVVFNDKLVGIISNKDILSVTPDLIEVLREQKNIAEAPLIDFPDQLAVTGYCEQCGNWSRRLTGSNGNLLCEACID